MSRPRLDVFEFWKSINWAKNLSLFQHKICIKTFNFWFMLLWLEFHFFFFSQNIKHHTTSVLYSIIGVSIGSSCTETRCTLLHSPRPLPLPHPSLAVFVPYSSICCSVYSPTQDPLLGLFPPLSPCNLSFKWKIPQIQDWNVFLPPLSVFLQERMGEGDRRV